LIEKWPDWGENGVGTRENRFEVRGILVIMVLTFGFGF